MNDLRPTWFGSMDDKHHPRWVRRTAVSKRGLKGSLVVVVATITAQLTKSFDVRDGQMKHTCQVDAFTAFSGGSILGTSMSKTVQLYSFVISGLSIFAS